jgi:F0F1-type ATP synthase assembly protein I
MAKSKTVKVKELKRPMLHLSLFDWRVSIVLGFMFGIIVGTAPSMIGTILLLGMIVGTITLVQKDRI